MRGQTIHTARETKEVNRSRISEDIQYNGIKEKYQRGNQKL